MAGRKRRVYVRGEHVQTLFEKCVFRVAQGEFTNFLTNLREKDLEEIAQSLNEIKKIAIPVATRDFGKLTRP